MNKFYIFVGLGNPGKKYQFNRHNVGFMVLQFFVDKLQQKYNLQLIQDFKFSSIINVFKMDNKKIVCVFPLTFMNFCGIAVKQILDYYNIKEFKNNLLVIYDDMDINLGNFKLKFNGGDAGHNGIKSIIQHIGKDFYRLRIGISRPLDKNYREYVLQDFLPDELMKINLLLPVIYNVLENIIKEGIELTMSKIGIFLIRKE